MSRELLKFQAKFAKEIIEQVVPEPLWSSKNVKDEDLFSLAGLNRPPFPSQVENGVLPLCVGLDTYKVGILNGEMGIGKTQVSYSTAFMQLKDIKDGRKRKLLFLTAGGKHLPKMIAEAEAIFGDRCVVKTIVNKNSFDKIKKGEIIPEDVYKEVAPEGVILIYILSKDTAKMDLAEEPVYHYGDFCHECGTKILPKTKSARKKLNKTTRPLECLNCGTSFISKIAKNICEHAKNEDGTPMFTKSYLHTCLDENGDVILNEDGTPKIETVVKSGILPQLLEKQRTKGLRKTSVGQKFRRIRKNAGDKVFGMTIVDEVHEMQSGTSLQGRVYRDLVSVSNKTLIMSGTLSNGYASSVFYILQAILPLYFKKLGYGFNDVAKFVEHFGARKTKTSTVERVGTKTFVKIQELPKISDRIVTLLAPFSVWIKMEDLNLKMPPYSENAHIVPIDNHLLVRLNEFKDKSIELIKKHNPKLLKSFAQRFMYLQNNPAYPYEFEFDGIEKIVDEETGIETTENRNFSVTFDAFESNMLFLKEKKLLELVESHKERGRKILLYSIYNKAAFVSDRLKTVLENSNLDLKVNVMPDHISGEKIEPWINQNDDCDVLIVSPMKVATGLDLVQFPTIIFYETGITLRMVQQAARRSWRAVGQNLPVEVEFLAYNGIQAHILDIMAKKMKSAATIEGKRVQDGQIASMFDDDADFTAALNSIADNLEEEFKPDFSSSKIEVGKLRPSTFLEDRYQVFLDSALEAKEATEEIETEVEANVETEVEANVETEAVENVEEEAEIEAEAETQVESETERKLRIKEVANQLYFEF